MPALSSVSSQSEDSLPLGCDSHHYQMLKLARALKAKQLSSGGSTSSGEKDKEVRFSECAEVGLILRNLPCVRFYLDPVEVPPTPATVLIQEMLGVEGNGARMAMLRMQEPLVMSNADPGRYFTVSLNCDLTLAVGVTAEGRSKVGALPKRFQVPTRAEKLQVVLLQARRGDVIKVHASPCVTYLAKKDEATSPKVTRGELTFYLNNNPDPVVLYNGTSSVQHDFTVQDAMCGAAFWVGGLTDLVSVEG